MRFLCWKAVPKAHTEVSCGTAWPLGHLYCHMGRPGLLESSRRGTSANSSLSSQGWPGIQCNVLNQSQVKPVRSVKEKQSKEVFPLRQYKQVNVIFLVKASLLISQVMRNLASGFSRRKNNVSILKKLHCSLKKPLQGKFRSVSYWPQQHSYKLALKNNTMNKSHSCRNFLSRELKL